MGRQVTQNQMQLTQVRHGKSAAPWLRTGSDGLDLLGAAQLHVVRLVDAALHGLGGAQQLRGQAGGHGS